ncbi:MAG: hypothetical protein LAO31_04610 [Acidobacteriia bacterium]|nr:hypothetical protein [Terriglobia bacterium]
MSNDIALALVIVVSVAILVQVGILYGIFQAMSRLNQQVTTARESFDRAKEPLLADIKVLLNQSIELVSNLNRISGDFSKISSTALHQVEKVGSLVSETTDLAQNQVRRLDVIVTDAIDHIERTTKVVQANILGPVREVSAVIKGIKMGLEFLTSKRRPAAVDKATQDEAMFI